MGKNYHIVDKKHKDGLAKYLSRAGQMLLPLVELLENAKPAVDELIDVAGRSAIEAVLKLSAQGGAGAKRQGKPRGESREPLPVNGRRFSCFLTPSRADRTYEI
jgi:hypothetical protein